MNSSRCARLLINAMLFIATLAFANGEAATALANSIKVGTAVAGERVIDLPLRDGRNQRVLYASPKNPRAVIVMLPGGAGDIGIEANGQLRHGDNFVVRTRALWVARGYAVVVPDSVNGKNLRGSRSSPAYAELVSELVTFAHAQTPGAVFLLGTSQGAIAAMNGAAHVANGQLAGVVLTESVSRKGGSNETVFDANPGDVRIPALVVANHDDRCDVAPPADEPRIAAAMSHSTQVKVLYVSGGTRRSRDACGSLTPHGYYGIEPDVVGQIADWMDALARYVPLAFAALAASSAASFASSRALSTASAASIVSAMWISSLT